MKPLWGFRLGEITLRDIKTMCCFRLGEITLRDIKTLVERPGHYRYHFKAIDPEFGTVKEEAVHDDDVVPGWEGKVVAWIEEDHG